MVLQNEDMSNSRTVMGNYDVKGLSFHISRNQNKLTATVSSRDKRIDFSDSLEPYLATYKVTTTDHTAYVDGIQTATKALDESINWGATTIGRNGGPLGDNIEEWYWEGSIGEIRIYNYALSDAEREAVEEQLHNKWFGPLPLSAVNFSPTPNLREGTDTVADEATVGTLSAIGGIGEVTYSLVSGDGDDDNGSFEIDGNDVKVNGEALTEGSYYFRVKAVDEEGNEVENSFSIVVAGPRLVLHLDALALEGLNNGDSVAIWEDLSGLDNDATQLTSANCPTYAADGLNGRPAVQFNGSSQYLNLDWNLPDGALKPMR